MNHQRFSSGDIMTTTTAWPLGWRAAAAAMAVATLAACGGGGVDFPAPAAAASAPTADEQRKAVTALATDVTEPLRQAIATAVSGGQSLTTVQTSFPAQPVVLPSGGQVTEVRVEYGGAIVADVALPPAAAASAPSGPPPAAVETTNPPTTPGKGQLIWVAYPAAPGIVRWYCFGSYADVGKDTAGACLYPGDAARGMTWGTYGDAAAVANDHSFGVSWAECNATSPPTLGRSGLAGICDPYTGDWHVLRKLPVLCLRIDASKTPPAGWVRQPQARPWLGGDMALTPPVLGVQLLGQAPGDALCSQQFGAGWAMAAFHDGGGWGIVSNGVLPNNTRYWARIADQGSNPWCATLTGLPCRG
jgi:hypothetical protein